MDKLINISELVEYLQETNEEIKQGAIITGVYTRERLPLEISITFKMPNGDLLTKIIELG